jgi:DNA-binding transcriptional MocR family regulator
MVACAVDELGLVPESLREVCKRGGVRGLFTMPTVQNPLGFVTPESRRVEIVAIAREFELTIIEDDAYGYMEEPAPPSYVRLAPERTFYVRGLAKSLAPGARTGFLVAPESAAGAVASSLKCTATGTDVVQNRAALAMCEDGSLDALMQAKREEGARRNAAARALLGEGVVAPGARCAWHLWIPLRQGVEPGDVERTAKEAGVMITNGRACAAGPGFGRGIRIALGGEVERERALEGVSRMAEVLRGL